MSKFKLLHSLPLLAFLGGLAAFSAHAQSVDVTLLDDKFTAAGPTSGLGQDANGYLAPTSTQAVWYGGGAVPTYTQGTSIKQSAGNRGLLAYISPSTSLNSIDVGETLTAKVTFMYTGGTGSSPVGDFRMGFLNSGGNGTAYNDGASANPRPDGEALPAARIVNDNFSLTAGGNTPRGYSGYLVDTTASGTPSSNSLSFWRRDGGQGKSQQWLGPTSSDITANSTLSQIGTYGGGTAGPIANNGTVYVATLSVKYVTAPTKNSDGDVIGQGVMQFQYSVTSGGSTVMSYSTTETANSQYTGFDAFFMLTTYNAALEVTELQIVRTSVAPSITTQPTDVVVAAGQDATFTVAATGAPAPTYQWQKDGTDISGATSATLTVSAAQPADAGSYRAVITNSAGSVTSSAASLTVLTAPEITSQAQDQSIFQGQDTTFAVGVRGAPTLTYQWQKDGTPISDGGSISGTTTATLTFTGAALSDAGTYTLVITNTYGTATSQPVTLAVYEATPPTIATQPMSQTVTEGTDVQFTVAADGPPPFTYLWMKDGVPLADDGRITGSATATLNIGAARLTDAGSYTVNVNNFANRDAPLTSAAATLTVNAAPVPLAPTAVAARFVTETGFTAEWNRATNATGYYLDVSSDSAFGSFVTGYENLDVGAALSAAVSGLTIDTTYYYRLRAYNSAGTSGNSNTITVQVQTPVAPTITSDASTVFTAGVAGSFTVTATGAPAPFFWATGLPSWATLDASSGVLSGTPPADAAGTQVNFTITASNDKAPDATQDFTIWIQAVPTVGQPLTVTTLAGQAGTSGATDASGAAARFKLLSGVAVDSSDNIFIADTGNHLIRKVTSGGAVTTFAGKAGIAGSDDGTGTAASFNTPSGIAFDANGNLYVADTLNHTIRKITSAGVVTTYAGQAGTSGWTDGAVADARFFGPQGLAADPTGAILYVADTNNHTIRQIVLSTGMVSTLAGQAGAWGSTDGAGSAARFYAPSDLAVDKNGSIYVADTENHTVRTVSPSGVVNTLAGKAGASGAADGTGSAARFDHPSAVAVDSALNVYVLDTDNHTIREIVSAGGVVSTIAGQAGTSGSADGIGAVARFKYPAGIAVNSKNVLYIADTDNHTLRAGVLPQAPTIETQPQSQSVTVGTNVQFKVKASGVPDVTYQWKREGAPIANATTDTLSLSSVAAADAGSYTVDVTNALGTVTSNPAMLVVNPVPVTPVGISGLGGGGGAPSTWFYLALALLGAARWANRRRNRA